LETSPLIAPAWLSGTPAEIEKFTAATAAAWQRIAMARRYF